MTDSLFLAAAHALAASVSRERFERGSLYPDQSDLRLVSRAIAIEVVREAKRLNLGHLIPDSEIEAAVDRAMWYPSYRDYVA